MIHSVNTLWREIVGERVRGRARRQGGDCFPARLTRRPEPALMTHVCRGAQMDGSRGAQHAPVRRLSDGWRRGTAPGEADSWDATPRRIPFEIPRGDDLTFAELSGRGLHGRHTQTGTIGAAALRIALIARGVDADL